jgi:hypothetical protein
LTAKEPGENRTTSAAGNMIRTILLLLGIAISMVLTVLPELATSFYDWLLKAANLSSHGLGPAGTEPVSRFFGFLSPVLVGFLSFDIGKQVEAARARRSAPPRLTFPANPTGLLEPYRSILLYTQLPSFTDYNAALQHLQKSVLLSNHKLISVADPQNLDRLLEDRSVVGLIMDVRLREEALRRARRGVTVYLAERHRSYGAAMGNPVTLRLGDDLAAMENVYRTAFPLTKAYIPDVAKSVGFHGTWATTYGLLAIREDFRGNASGVYWYGAGQIRGGSVDIDIDQQVIFLSCQWDQRSNATGTGAIGSRNRGDAVFRMAAGADVFFGYWHQTLIPDHAQLWSGTRLSSDIIRDIRASGPFYRNFGLGQHARTNIVDPEETA